MGRMAIQARLWCGGGFFEARVCCGRGFRELS